MLTLMSNQADGRAIENEELDNLYRRSGDIGLRDGHTTERRANRQLARDNAALNARAEQLANENETLATRLRDAERGSRLRQSSSPTRTEGSGSINSSNMASGKDLFTRLMRGDPVRLTAEQADRYLKQHGRTAQTLLAAFRATGNEELLREAQQKFPKDQQVAFEGAFRDGTPEERRQRLDAFKTAAPDNPLANTFQRSTTSGRALRKRRSRS